MVKSCGWLQMVELEGAVQIVWHICLNRGAARISKTEHFLKSGEVMEGPRRDGRPGILRSQLSITPEGHVHIRFSLHTPCGGEATEKSDYLCSKICLVSMIVSPTWGQCGQEHGQRL